MHEQQTTQSSGERSGCASLPGWMAATRELAGRARAESVTEELARISRHFERSGVRLAVAGVSQRVRARQVNQLLNDTVLPADIDLDVPVLITVGQRYQVEAQTSQGWVAVGSEASDAGGWRWEPAPSAAAAFWLRVERDQLVAPGLELVSVAVPARHDRRGDDAGWATLAAADAAVLVVQATAAMTRTETQFLAELVRDGMAAERILVVATRIDLVDADERTGLLDHIRKRAGEISPSLVALPAELDRSAEPELAESLREWVTSAVRPGWEQARARQLASQLCACLRRVADSAAAAGQEVQRQRRLLADQAAAAAAALADDMRVFDRLTEDIRGRHIADLSEFLRCRERFATRLSADLLHQLSASPDPADWWAKELPYQLQARLPMLEQEIRQLLQYRISEGARLLADELATRFGVQPRQLSVVHSPEPVVPVPAELDLTSLHRRRLLYRTGPTGIALLVVLAVPAIGPVAALTATLVGTGLGEIRIRGLAEEQRIEIRRRLPGLLDELMNTYGDQLCSALDEVYQQHEEEVGWLREQRQAAAAETPALADRGLDIGPGPWDEIQAECARLIQVIRGEMPAEGDTSTDRSIDLREGLQ
jgi:hypothetical protein